MRVLFVAAATVTLPAAVNASVDRSALPSSGGLFAEERGSFGSSECIVISLGTPLLLLEASTLNEVKRKFVIFDVIGG